MEKHQKGEILNEVKKMDIIGKFNGWREYRRTVNELSLLSNRELADLGIARGDIRRIARNGR